MSLLQLIDIYYHIDFKFVEYFQDFLYDIIFYESNYSEKGPSFND